MLYDPKWGRKAKLRLKPKTLEHLIAWLERQPAERVYCFTNNGTCLLAQYKRSYSPRSTYALLDEFPRSFMFAAGIESDDWTFGAALTRARALMSDNRPGEAK